MLIERDYNKETRLDRIWYNSSNICYSECYDNPESNLKDLKVVFKNGGTYLYKNVDVNDYVMFVHGGLDGSNGKALNKFIKPKAEFEKLENTDLQLLDSIRYIVSQEKWIKKQVLSVGDVILYESSIFNGTGYTAYVGEIIEVIDDNSFKVRRLDDDYVEICPLYEKKLISEDKKNPYKPMYSITRLTKVKDKENPYDSTYYKTQLKEK